MVEWIPLVWWLGYWAGLQYYVPNRNDLTPADIALPLVKAIFWPVTLPVSIVYRRFKTKAAA